jgi:hypothetical protein
MVDLQPFMVETMRYKTHYSVIALAFLAIAILRLLYGNGLLK